MADKEQGRGEATSSVRSDTLCAVDVVRVCAVLQDCEDQLAVVENVISGTHSEAHAAAASVLDDIRVLQAQQVAAKIRVNAAMKGEAWTGGVSEATQYLHQTERKLKLRLDSSHSYDNLRHVQSERRFVSQVISELLRELQEEGTFSSVIHCIQEQEVAKAKLQDSTFSSKDDPQIRALKKQLKDIHIETTLQIQERDKIAAHLEDQLQEKKMKQMLQEKYVKASTQLLVYQGQKLNSQAETQLADDVKMQKKQLLEEERNSQAIQAFLKDTWTHLEEKLEYWMDRYDKDMEEIQQKLNTVKDEKRSIAAQLHDLAQQYQECEQVIIEDRLEKENLRKRLEEEELQRKAAIKIQAWWRGMLVRKCLGPFKKGKKQKKEGKKAKK